MILFDKNLIINIEYRPSIRLNQAKSGSWWVFKKYFTLHCLAEIFCYYHTHLLMKTFAYIAPAGIFCFQLIQLVQCNVKYC